VIIACIEIFLATRNRASTLYQPRPLSVLPLRPLSRSADLFPTLSSNRTTFSVVRPLFPPSSSESCDFSLCSTFVRFARPRPIFNQTRSDLARPFPRSTSVRPCPARCSSDLNTRRGLAVATAAVHLLLLVFSARARAWAWRRLWCRHVRLLFAQSAAARTRPRSSSLTIHALQSYMACLS
jgi:hypothetical protein